MPELSLSPRFAKAMKRMTPEGQDLVRKALKAFLNNMWSKSLNFEKIKGTAYCSIRASRGLRIVLRKTGTAAYDVVDVGEHDYIYRTYG